MDENPYQAPIASESRRAFRLVRSGMARQIIGLFLYAFATVSFFMIILLIAVRAERYTSAHELAVFSAIACTVYGLLGGAMLWAGYRIRRVVVTPPDSESAAPF